MKRELREGSCIIVRMIRRLGLLTLVPCCWSAAARRHRPSARWCSTEVVHRGWKACRPPADPSRGCSDEETWNVTRLPTTALAVLLDNQKIPGAEHLRLDGIYFSTNLELLPDIYDIGRDYYTLLYELKIPALMDVSCRDDDVGPGISAPRTRQTIRIAGTNYRSRAWRDGEPLGELSPHGGAAGMFVRRNFDVTAGGRFNLLIEPPDHPGKPNCGQGGE